MEGVLYGGLAQSVSDECDDDEPDYGKILPLELFIERIKTRGDIFSIDGDTRLSKVEGACLSLAIATGLLVGTVEIAKPSVIFPASSSEPLPESTFSLSTEQLQITATTYSRIIPKPHNSDRFTVKPNSNETGHRVSGVGDPSARQTRENVFRMISNRLAAFATPGVDQGTQLIGISHGIETVLNGVHALKRGSGTESGRRTLAGIGSDYGIGHSGMQKGDGTDGDDLLNGLMEPDASPLALRSMQHSESLDQLPNRTQSALSARYAINGRSKSSIMQTVLDNLPALRYAYNRWLRLHPGASGKITMKFAIDEFGNVIFCDVVNGTLKDPDLSDQIISIVKTWRFGKIDKPGDITEAVYPLVFSM
jgi:hypothetical protein